MMMERANKKKGILDFSHHLAKTVKSTECCHLALAMYKKRAASLKLKPGNNASWMGIPDWTLTVASSHEAHHSHR
jgi:hypothetical protein